MFRRISPGKTQTIRPTPTPEYTVTSPKMVSETHKSKSRDTDQRRGRQGSCGRFDAADFEVVLDPEREDQQDEHEQLHARQPQVLNLWTRTRSARPYNRIQPADTNEVSEAIRSYLKMPLTKGRAYACAFEASCLRIKPVGCPFSWLDKLSSRYPCWVQSGYGLGKLEVRNKEEAKWADEQVKECAKKRTR